MLLDFQWRFTAVIHGSLCHTKATEYEWRQERGYMINREQEIPLYDATGFKSPARFWRSLLRTDTDASQGFEPEDVQHKRRVILYRLLLPVMFFATAMVLTESLLSTPSPLALDTFSGVVTLLLAATMFRLFRHEKILIPPVFALLITLITVVWSIKLGSVYQELWVFLLMIALTALLPFVIALGGGLVTLGALFWAHGWQGFGQGLAFDAAIFSTWLLSLAIMQLQTRQTDELADLALTDPLTGAYNRRYLLPQTRRHLADYHRYARLSSLLLLDIDYFKRINDEMGHVEGDRVLKAMVALIDSRIRGADMLFRLGGEEFVVLLSEVGAQTARKIADELRSKIASQEVIPDRRVTVSIGICDVTAVDSAEDWLLRVDRAMYEAKRKGRDQVYIEEPSPRDPTNVEATIPMWR